MPHESAAKNEPTLVTLNLTVTAGTYRLLENLADNGRFGRSAEHVAEGFVYQGLRENSYEAETDEDDGDDGAKRLD